MSEKKDFSEQLLISELKNHNEKAFRTLYDCYSQDIYRYSLSILKSKELPKRMFRKSF